MSNPNIITNIIKGTFTASINACLLTAFGFAIERAYIGGDWQAYALLAILAFLFRIAVFFSNPDVIQQYVSIAHIYKSGKVYKQGNISTATTSVLQDSLTNINKELGAR